MKIYNNVLELIGGTPLIRLNKLADDTMATVLVKAEYLNPAGSIKDRMAAHILQKAEEAGKIKPGGTIVEGTSGNTGQGLAMAAAVKGYKAIFTMPDKMSAEKANMMKAYGAKVIVTRTDVHHDDPQSYTEMAKTIAKNTPNSLYADQYNNLANVEAHYQSTGPEIWEDTDGQIDYLVAGGSTGGTVSGTGRYLKEQAKKVGREVKVVASDPPGSILYDLFHGNPVDPHVYKVEGIGNDVFLDCMDMKVLDDVIQVTDREAFLMARRLAKEEGIFAGGSSGSNVCAAIQIAKKVGPGKVVVAILPDSGNRYISKIFNDEWMKDIGFLDLDSRLGTVRDLLNSTKKPVEFVKEGETIASVASRMAEMGISQMPYKAVTGYQMVHEGDLLQSLLSGQCLATDLASKAAKPIQGVVTVDAPVSVLESTFDADRVAVVMDGQELIGIIAKIDLIKYLASKQ